MLQLLQAQNLLFPHCHLFRLSSPKVPKNSPDISESILLGQIQSNSIINRGERNTANIVNAGFNQTTDETLEDPYDSIWLRLIAVFVYLLIILSSCLMMAFTYYEQLYHGHYRTVINQLITNLYNVVCIAFSKNYLTTYTQPTKRYELTIHMLNPTLNFFGHFC